MSNSDNKLYDLVKFYESEIKPFRYIYNCDFGIKIDLTIEPKEVCHLLFGYVKDKNIPNAKNYKGIKGYNCILDKTVKTPHHSLSKAFSIKSVAFNYLPKLLENPDIIIFNPSIAGKGQGVLKNIDTTDIKGDFLFYKKIDNKLIHLFLKWDDRQNRFVAMSLFHNTKDNYIEKQIIIKTKDKSKKERNDL